MSKKNRHSHFDSYKTPKAVATPYDNKSPRAVAVPNDRCQPEFKAEQMDMEGPWGWRNFEGLQIQEFLQRVFECQKLTWQTLRDNGAHSVDVATLVSDAQKRLKHIKKEDLEHLYSLRLSGRKRIWGIKEGNILWLLWWDPNHEVCPSHKKHT